MNADDGFTVPEPTTAAAAKPKRTRNRKSKGDAVAELRERIGEAIAELGEWIGERDAELGRVLKEDAPKMAGLLAAWATHPKAPPPLVFAIRLVAAVLEPVRAFGRTARLVLARMGERRARAYADGGDWPEPVYAEPEAPVDEAASRTPDRFRADAEPPAAE